MKKTKIVCSIGPASSDISIMSKMVENGMNVARINCSHATLKEKETVTNTVKEVRKITGMPIAIMYDTKGPEFRSGVLKGEHIELIEGSNIRIVKNEVIGNEERISVNHPTALESLEIGSDILLQNGLMKIKVISIENDGVTCKVINGGILGNKKSICVPGIHLDIPFISSDDKEDIIYACEHDCDFIALSFVTKGENVLQVRKILKEYNREDIKLISKIESQTGYDNLNEIIDVSDGIMVGRGDLGDEIPIGKLPIYQKNMIKKCREQGKIVIVATEMLDSMINNSRPTRAEVLDVANAVLDGSDAVMLSGETTIGKYPKQVVKFMGEICEEAENYYNYDKEYNFAKKTNLIENIAQGIVDTSKRLKTKLIVINTKNGDLVRAVSNLKPKCMVLAIVENESMACSLALNYGVYSINSKDNYEKLDESFKNKISEKVELNEGDNIIITTECINNIDHMEELIKIKQI